jgi:uncharacterized membrane protein YraQ (UPF0718 family)
MKKKGRKPNMLWPTIVMGIIAVVLLYIGYRQEGGQHIAGLRSALDMTIEILPLLIFAFIVAGMAQILIPKELLSKWVGAESGFRGILIGTVAGGFTPGGPFVSLPIAAGLFRSGASMGTMVAFLTGWSLWGINRIPMEVGILGWRLTMIRFASTFFFPPIAGLIAQAIFRNTG